MNFFKKKKKSNKEVTQKFEVTHEPIRLNGSSPGAYHNGIDGSNEPDLVPSPRFDLSLPSEPLPNFPTRSRLSKSLDETLKDDAALGHFIQFMESQGACHLVRFWLDAESFRITARSRLCSELNNAQPKGACAKKAAELPATNGLPTERSAFSKENRDNASLEAAMTLSKASILEEKTVGESLTHPSHTKLSPSRDISKNCRETTLPPSASLSSSSSAKNTTTPQKQIEKDAVFIYQKYICPNVTNRIELTEEAYHSIVSRICCEDGRVDPLSFVDAQNAVFEEMGRRFPVYRESEHHLKYQIDLLTGTKLTLSDVLYHENALVHFMEFVEIEGGLPLIQFWLLLENFAKLLPVSGGRAKGASPSSSVDSSGSSGSSASSDGGVDFNGGTGPSEEDVLAQNDAMIIYDKYFSLQATEALGFGDDVRFQVESNICTEDGKVDAECFETPVKLVLNLIANEYLQPFLRSSICYRWLSELINCRRLGGLPNFRPRNGSDASSSEASVGSSSQATGSSKKSSGKKREKKTVHDMLGESRIDVDDPDAIWRRKHNAGPLTFGKIDPMGDYQSELAFHPDTLKKRGSSRITKALKSLVQDESEIRAREDMAAQVAQMVINDVTSLTMGKPAYDFQGNDDDDGATDAEGDDS